MRGIRPLTLRLARDERGVVTIIFAMILIPLLGMAALAIDYGRASGVKTRLQRAADAGITAVAQAQTRDQSKLTKTFAAHFRANLPDRLAKTPFTISISDDKKRINAVAETSVSTPLMSVFGQSTTKVVARSSIRVPQRKEQRSFTRSFARKKLGNFRAGNQPTPSAAASGKLSNADAEKARRRLRDMLKAAMATGNLSPGQVQRLERMINQIK